MPYEGSSKIVDYIFGGPLGHYIRLTRRTLGLSSAQLSVMVGVSQSWITRLENGYGIPSTQLSERIAVALSVPVEEIVQRRALWNSAEGRRIKEKKAKLAIQKRAFWNSAEGRRIKAKK